MYHLIDTRLLRWLESSLASTLVATCIAMLHMASLTNAFRIQPLAGGKCRSFRRVIERECLNFVFISISVFTVCFAFGFLFIVLCEQDDHIVLKLYSFLYKT